MSKSAAPVKRTLRRGQNTHQSLTSDHASRTMASMSTVPVCRIAHNRRGVTLSETLVTAAVVGVLLVLVGLGVDGIRNELKRKQTVALLDTLDRAIVAYHQSAGNWPAEASESVSLQREPADADDPDENASGDRIVAILAEVPAAHTILQTIPEVLRVPADQSEQPTTRPALGLIRDPWGHRLCCLTAFSPSPSQRKAVAANGNRPVFISAGPDGRLGFLNVSAASDNLRSDELQK